VRYSKLKAKLETRSSGSRKRSSRSRTRFPPTSCRGVLVPHRSRATLLRWFKPSWAVEETTRWRSND